MSDFEVFSFNEAGESYDPAAFERFKEKVKKNAKFVAALRKSEQKQKQKEDVLLKILMRFFQKNQSRGVVLLASRMLEQNIPAAFVLAVIILGNEELQKEAQNVLLLNKPQNAGAGGADKTEFSLISAFRDESIPLKLKAEIDEWGRGLLEAGLTQPYRLLETALDHEGNVKRIVIDCMANVVQEFLEKSAMQNLSYETTFSFCEFLSHGVLKRVKTELENRRLLENSGDNL